LVKNGIPWDVAVNLSHKERVAWAIIFGEIEGGEFDYRFMKWKEKRYDQ
jgi:hypothetical protein